ncbi:hypothetical protein RJ639_001728 [Escallonia herrerae]|uniref:DUF599 domain-containing protein n=1 Tax=Escallonia herrerae TaxID=1293975 RepID=A0AA88X9D6_9ASTE|nr:hypothetical protein RJ639_001728 [Escallonia herrerae]
MGMSRASCLFDTIALVHAEWQEVGATYKLSVLSRFCDKAKEEAYATGNVCRNPIVSTLDAESSMSVSVPRVVLDTLMALASSKISGIILGYGKNKFVVYNSLGGVIRLPADTASLVSPYGLFVSWASLLGQQINAQAVCDPVVLMMERQILDYVLVPSGLALMVSYHIWLLYQILNHPTRTVVGINAINRRFWVRAMMEDAPKNGVLAVQTLRNNIMASTVLASTAITLSSIIALLMSNISGSERSTGGLVYGDRSDLGFSIKFFSILVCFLLAFLQLVQSIRYYSHAGILINVPYKIVSSSLSLNGRDRNFNHNLAAEYVGQTMNRGSYFWSLGLRAFYLSFPLFLWIFGPIPMFLSCLVLVFLFYFLDVTVDFGRVNAGSLEDMDEEADTRDQVD